MSYGSEAREEISGRSDSAANRFVRALWKSTDFENTAQVERSTRIGKAIGDYDDCESAFKAHDNFTSDSGTDKGGNNQN